jgi:hypothetical protein
MKISEKVYFVSISVYNREGFVDIGLSIKFILFSSIGGGVEEAIGASTAVR